MLMMPAKFLGGIFVPPWSTVPRAAAGVLMLYLEAYLG